MRKAVIRFSIAFITIGLLFSAFLQPSYGIWQVLLNEDFAKDQSVPGLLWPWNTPPENLGANRWHWNPQPPHRLAEPQYTDYCWGLQNYIYNSMVRRHEAFPQSLWCAYTNRGNVQNPRWPADVDYMDNQNAWVWWGPVNLRNARSAAVVFWYYLDCTVGCMDSLVVIVTRTNAVMTDPRTLRNDTRVAYGVYYDDEGNPYYTWFKNRVNEWQRRQFYLDDLRFLDARGNVRDTVVNWCQRRIRIGDRDSIAPGESTVWLAFVWLSNERVVTGKGAFIDDIMMVWDDGKVDIHPAGSYIGVVVNEDSTQWLSSYTPRLNEDIKFKLNWKVDGDLREEVGPFRINCYLDSDDNLIYTEERTALPGDSVYTTIADTIWTVPAGEHYVLWRMDTEGRIDETDENNNFIRYNFFVEWNPPPMFDILTPSRDSTIIYAEDTNQEITFTVVDSNETDTEFTVYLYFTKDISGLQADPNAIYEYNYIAHSFRVRVGENRLVWNAPQDWERGRIADGDLVYIVGFATDGYPGNMTIAMAPGRFLIRQRETVVKSEEMPKYYNLMRAFPNPFNQSLTIEYVLPAVSEVNLEVFDLMGRYITCLTNEMQQPGKHIAIWQPDNLEGGVYLIRLKVADKVFYCKAVYTP